MLVDFIFLDSWCFIRFLKHILLFIKKHYMTILKWQAHGHKYINTLHLPRTNQRTHDLNTCNKNVDENHTILKRLNSKQLQSQSFVNNVTISLFFIIMQDLSKIQPSKCDQLSNFNKYLFQNGRFPKRKSSKFNPLMQNIPKWTDKLTEFRCICCKIFKVCLTILRDYASKS